jgi:hypothetical protein
MPHQAAIQLLREAVSRLQNIPDNSSSRIAILCRTWRAQTTLLSALPPRFAEVAEHFLCRLEAGSIFTEESRSFNQQDLFDHLHAWLDQAQLALKKSASV